MPQNAFFPQTCDLLVSQKRTQTLFFPTLHPLSLVIFAACCHLYCFAILGSTSIIIHSMKQRLLKNWLRSDLSWLLARKITKGIHSCKPASLNRPVQRELDMHRSCAPGSIGTTWAKGACVEGFPLQCTSLVRLFLKGGYVFSVVHVCE